MRCTTGQSGLDNRPCTMQLGFFANGSVKILSMNYLYRKMFEEKCRRKKQCNKRVTVFQKHGAMKRSCRIGYPNSRVTRVTRFLLGLKYFVLKRVTEYSYYKMRQVVTTKPIIKC